jgi:hypothetical protein
MSEPNIDLNLSRRRLLGLGAAVIPAAMVLGSGVANARPNLWPQPDVAATAATPVRLPAHSQAVYFC